MCRATEIVQGEVQALVLHVANMSCISDTIYGLPRVFSEHHWMRHSSLSLPMHKNGVKFIEARF